MSLNKINLYYDKKWIALKLIEILYVKHLVKEELWASIKKGNIAYFTNDD